MFSKYRLLTLLLFLCFSSIAQKETALWHFGPKLSLDFSSGTAKFVANNSMLSTIEGSSSICDKEGNLLFYTDGVTLWDATHQVMPNGTNLKGHFSSTTSALIVPMPGNSNLYYIFTSDEEGEYIPPNDGIHYSIVNMCLNKGKGDVEEATKNTHLYKPATEKLAAVLHSNGEDIWIMSHKWNSNEFYAYLLTASGLNPTPVISAVGRVHSGDLDNNIGQMKFSPDGKRLALAIWKDDQYDLFDFDASTGKVSNPIALKTTIGYGIAYGLEFSPDASKLYVSFVFGLQQYDLSLPTPEQIIASMESIPRNGGGMSQIGGLQLGLDGKIYVNKHYEQREKIGVINNPNAKGVLCDYVDNQIISNNLYTSGTCFPSFMASYFSPKSRIDYQHTCLGESTSFWINQADSLSAVEWSFGESGGLSNTSGEKLATHLYAQPGSYGVQALLTYKDGKKELLSRKINILPSQKVDLGRDTLLCEGQNLTLDVSSFGGYPLWQDGSTASGFTVTTPGTYWVEICKGNCSSRDSIVVEYIKPIAVELGEDQILCTSTPIKLSAKVPHGSYEWSNGSKEEEITVTQTGTYYVSVTTLCEQAWDTIQITFEDVPAVNLGEDVSLCVGDTLLLDAYAPQAKGYRWQKLEKNAQYSSQSGIAIREEGSYEVELSSGNCLVKDTIVVTFLECEDKLFIPNVITPNGDGKNDHFQIKGILIGNWQLEIYNRYGKNIYRTASYQNDWNGADQAGNIFYYYLYNPISQRKYKGWIQILR